MKIRDRIASMFGYQPKVQALGSDRPSQWQEFSNMGGVSHSGIPVNTKTAIRASAVLACVRVLAETLAQVPLFVYRRVGDKGKERATDHPLYQLLHKSPNETQTSFEWRRLIQGHTAYRGNGFSEITWQGRFPVGLTALNPDRVTVKVKNDEIIRYEHRDQTGRTRIIIPDNMLHFTGLSSDGVMGINPIQAAAQSIGITLASDKFGATFFGNGANPSGVLSHPGALSVKAQDNLRDSLVKRTSGNNTNAPLIIEEAMKWERMSMTPDESQFLETRKFQVNDIARIFRVPSHMIGDLEKATLRNITDQSLAFVKYTMVSWFVLWEQRLTKSLIRDGDDSIFIEFMVDGLLRGDVVARSRALAIQFGNGAVNQDEWRAMENRNPIPDGEGQKFYRPMNLAEVGAEPVEPTDEIPGGVPGRQATNAEMFNSLLHDAANRIGSAMIRERDRGTYDKGKIESYVNKTLAPFGLRFTTAMPECHNKEELFQLLKDQRNDV